MSKLIHNIIKIKYVNEGYLPNYPYHLISDAEMCDAFISDDGTGFFYDFYPLPDDSLYDEYIALVDALKYHIAKLKESLEADYTMPVWVYSYMLGQVISQSSDQKDKHDLFVLMNMDNVEDDFSVNISKYCLKISKIWLSKIPRDKKGVRVPTMFGEPHVIKYLRLNSEVS